MKKLFWITLFVLLLIISFSLGSFYGQRNVSDKYDDVDLGPLWEAWDILEDRYVPSNDSALKETDVSDEDKVYGAIRGLAASYEDPYTSFFPPEENEIFESDIQGEFSGIGIEIGTIDGLLTVISPLKGTPADLAGLEAEDIIAEIDGVESSSISPSLAAQRIRGERGTEVVLGIIRAGESSILQVPIVRDTIQIPTIKTEIVDDVFVIEFYTFNALATEKFIEAIVEFSDSGLRDLVIDVRGNPGGFLSSAVDIGSLFVEKDKVIVTEDYGDNRPQNVRVSKGLATIAPGVDIAVLIDTGSASASEILAGALRDYERAILIGTNTFGKGSVQELVNITSDTALKVTIARWILPLGEQISEEGIAPDVEIEDDPETEEDEVLLEAIKVLTQ